MEFRILGPLEAREEGRSLGLGGAKQRALLAILLLHANEVVSSDRLIDDLWGEEPPETAASALRVHIAQLRKALGSSGVLLTRSPGYVLQIEPGQLDVDRFAQLVEEAGRAFADGRWKHASERLREALALWRGSPLADFAYERFAQTDISRLEELRLAALEKRIEADLALGRHAELVGELEALVAEHPLRERLRAQLMLALYRSGRQAEALAAYQDVRRILVEELGIDPGAELHDLERGILRQDPSLALLPGLPPLGRLEVPTNLPAQVTPLVGRRRELEATRALFGRPELRLLTLTGPGGTGKTRLALELASELTGGFESGVFFVALAPVRDPVLVPSAIAKVLGVRESGGQPLVESVKDFLRGRQLLLVLDNFEHIPAASPVVAELLAGASGLKVLATSRAPLHVAAEREFPVPPLSESEAVELFVQRAQAVRPDFALTDAGAATVADICAHLDCLPLAIELAAARARTLPPQAILERLGKRLALLTGGPRDVPARLQTLRKTIDWSHDLLDTAGKAGFRRLAVFVGGFSLDAAATVIGAGKDVEALDRVTALADQSLLVCEVQVGEPRFRMLETIREYALERLAASGEEAAIRNAHAEHFLFLSEHAELELRGPRQAAWLDRLETEHDNLRAALAWAAEGGDVEAGLRLGAALWRFWQVRGHLAEGRERVERLLALPDPSERTAVRAYAQACAGRLAWAQGDHAAARPLFEESLAVLRELGDTRGVAFSLLNLGMVANGQGDEAARSLLAEAATLSRQAGDPWLESGSLFHLGRAAYTLGDYSEARTALERSVRLAKEVGDLRLRANPLTILATIMLEQGDLDEAQSLFEEALAIQRELGDTWGVSSSLASLGAVALRQRGEAPARTFFEESLVIRRQAGDRDGIAASLDDLAGVAASRGQPLGAARLHGAAAAVREAAGIALGRVARHELDDRLAALRSGLGDEEFAAVWAQGRAMTLEQAVDEALGRLDLQSSETSVSTRRLENADG